MRFGIDLGGTKIEVAALAPSGEIVLRERTPTPRGDYEAIVAAIRDLVANAEGKLGVRGTVGVAIGCAGLPSLIDLRGQPDLFGRTLEVSIIGFADEIAAAASLLQGQAAEGQPVVVVRGLTWSAPEMPVAEVVRPMGEDLFR